ncbi:MAG: hypothetical protein QXT77_10185 [Candidatus Methanomethylicaceae archaeon]
MLSLLGEFYHRYNVRGSSFSCLCINANPLGVGALTDFMNFFSVAAVRGPGGTEVDPWGNQVTKRRFMKQRMVPSAANVKLPGGLRPLRMYMPTQSILCPNGVNSASNPFEVSSLVDANPTAQWFWRTTFSQPAMSITTAYFDVRIVYYVNFFHYKETLGDV